MPDAPRRDFRRSQFPVTIEALDSHGVVVWSTVVRFPQAVWIPPLADIHGPVAVRTTLADGTVHTSPAPLRH
jgi:hypothetical protein